MTLQEIIDSKLTDSNANQVIIGRSTDCGICLQDNERKLSRKHAIISREKGKYFIQDGSGDGKPSTNLTFLNGSIVPFDRKVEFKKKDLVTLSNRFELQLGEPIRDLDNTVAIEVNSVSQLFVTKRLFGKTSKKLALQNIDLDIEAGEFITIMGPSGCGKSTLIKIMSRS